MTMLSFRVDDDEAAQAQRWADQLGADKSELLRDALHRHLVPRDAFRRLVVQLGPRRMAEACQPLRDATGC